MIDEKLKKYIEQKIFPIYQNDNSGHGIEHIKSVIERSISFANQFEDINLNMVYTIAAFHDLAHHIDKDNHEILSAKMFYENEKMKEFFTDNQRKIIKEAIEDHRASLEYEPRSDYGKIVSSADSTPDIVVSLKRTHAYTVKHFNYLNTEQQIERAYQHISSKLGKDGYFKTYVVDKEFEQYKKDTEELLKDRDKFSKKYKEVNNINE